MTERYISSSISGVRDAFMISRSRYGAPHIGSFNLCLNILLPIKFGSGPRNAARWPKSLLQRVTHVVQCVEHIFRADFLYWPFKQFHI